MLVHVRNRKVMRPEINVSLYLTSTLCWNTIITPFVHLLSWVCTNMGHCSLKLANMSGSQTLTTCEYSVAKHKNLTSSVCRWGLLGNKGWKWKEQKNVGVWGKAKKGDIWKGGGWKTIIEMEDLRRGWRRWNLKFLSDSEADITSFNGRCHTMGHQ